MKNYLIRFGTISLVVYGACMFIVVACSFITWDWSIIYKVLTMNDGGMVHRCIIICSIGLSAVMAIND